MDWNQLVDRNGKYTFIRIGKALDRHYLPEDVQSLVDTHGVVETVRTINEHSQQLYHKNALAIVNHSGQLKVIQA